MIPLKDDIRSKSFPFFTWLIILANAIAFYFELKQGSQNYLEKFIQTWAVIPKQLFSDTGRHWFTVFTATFIHGGWMHIIFNMLFLHVFGDNVEDRLGHIKFLIFYLLLGVIANTAQAYTSPTSLIPLIGASGAISGILGAYFFYYPHSRIVTLIPIGFFITIREIPAFFFLGVWFFLQMLNGKFSNVTGGGTAWWAHASGFVAGMILAPVFGGKTSTRNR